MNVSGNDDGLICWNTNPTKLSIINPDLHIKECKKSNENNLRYPGKMGDIVVCDIDSKVDHLYVVIAYK